MEKAAYCVVSRKSIKNSDSPFPCTETRTNHLWEVELERSQVGVIGVGYIGDIRAMVVYDSICVCRRRDGRGSNHVGHP